VPFSWNFVLYRKQEGNESLDLNSHWLAVAHTGPIGSLGSGVRVERFRTFPQASQCGN
jgi:hypothetical protein